MSKYNGKTLNIEIFGESHSDFIGAKVYGLPRFNYDRGAVEAFMKRRRPKSDISTARRENDDMTIVYAPDGAIEMRIKNGDVKSGDYADLHGKPRPSHADYAAYLKYGTLDFSGGGAFSGRMTAPVCAVGALCLQQLEARGVHIAAYLYGAGGVFAKSYRDGFLSVESIEKERGDIIPSLSDTEEIKRKIEDAKLCGDSVGGAVDCVIEGDIAALGGPIFDGLEGRLSQLLFAIPAVKAVEFGAGTAFAAMTGSQANDQMYIDGGKVCFYTNNSGGINGGIANGARVNFSVTFRPTPSIAVPQKTVDLVKGENATITVVGRHDACVAVRAVPAVESMAAIAAFDELLSADK